LKNDWKSRGRNKAKRKNLILTKYTVFTRNSNTFSFFFYAFGALLDAFWAPFGDLFGS
jgi:hypothetical protein